MMTRAKKRSVDDLSEGGQDKKQKVEQENKQENDCKQNVEQKNKCKPKKNRKVEIELENKQEQKRIRLWDHQKEFCKELFHYEHDQILSLFQGNEYYFKGNSLIIGAMIGFGKTITILNYLEKNPTIVPNYNRKLYKYLTCMPRDLVKLISTYLYEKDFLKDSTKTSEKINVLQGMLNFHSGTSFFGQIELDNVKRILNCNIIIVPHSLIKTTWEPEVNNFYRRFSKMVYFINHKTTTPITLDVFTQHRVVIVNSNKYVELANFLQTHNIKVQRVIFDEIIDLKINHPVMIDAFVYYGITANYKDIVNKCFLKYLFNSRTQVITVKNIDKTVKVNPYIKKTIICSTPPEYEIISELNRTSGISKLVKEELFLEAKEILLSRIFSAVLNGSKIKLTNRGIARNKKQISAFDQIQQYSFLSVLELIMLKYLTGASVNKYIQIYKLLYLLHEEQICIHCCASYEKPSTLKCVSDQKLKMCNYLLYCEHCVEKENYFKDSRCLWCLNTEQLYSIDEMKAPKTDHHIAYLKQINSMYDDRYSHEDIMCNLYDDIDNIQIGDKEIQVMKRRINKNDKIQYDGFVDDFKEEKTEIKDNMSKKDALLEIFKLHPNDKILLFIKNPKLSADLKELLQVNNVKSRVLSGTSATIQKIKKDFDEDKINTLILEGNKVGSGLNLQKSNVIIIFSSDGNNLEKQLIGRAQRPGQENTLIVYQLKTL